MSVDMSKEAAMAFAIRFREGRLTRADWALIRERERWRLDEAENEYLDRYQNKIRLVTE